MKVSQSYKVILKERMALRKKTDAKFSSKWVAQQLDLQYTYLSKVFNQEGAHFSSEHLFQLCVLLKLDQAETDLVMLLKEFETSQNQKHREYLKRKIEKIGDAYQVGPEDPTPNDTLSEMEYLFDPISVLIHVGLSINSFRNNPVLFCDKLGLTVVELKQKLKLLARVGFVELDEDGLYIKALPQHKIHFGKTHPLMRIHQSIFKNKINSTLLELAETEKESFMATFSFDDDSFEEAKGEFKLFFNKLVKIQAKSTQKKLYQLNFDLFRWF